MRRASTSESGAHRLPLPPAPEDEPASAADALLQDELPRWIEQLSEEVLAVYRATEIGKADSGAPMEEALRAYFSQLSESNAGARIVSCDRIGVLYARAGMDLSIHCEMAANLFSLVGEGAAFRYRRQPASLVDALIEVQQRQWEDARAITDAYVQARERRLGQLVKQLSAARTDLIKLAHDDLLTGVRNRAYLFETLSAELDRARRYGDPLSLLFADLDHFKSMNDTHGHEAGDQALKQVASVFKRELRPQDIIGRYGGDEFVIGLLRASGHTAGQVAERLRASIEAAHLQCGNGSPPITLSIGVVSTTGKSESVVGLIRKADTAMYAAKAAGRNQVRFSSSGPRGAR
jgi:diguanylate cyclase (GGDEF)-like protein